MDGSNKLPLLVDFIFGLCLILGCPTLKAEEVFRKQISSGGSSYIAILSRENFTQSIEIGQTKLENNGSLLVLNIIKSSDKQVPEHPHAVWNRFQIDPISGLRKMIADISGASDGRVIVVFGFRGSNALQIEEISLSSTPKEIPRNIKGSIIERDQQSASSKDSFNLEQLNNILISNIFGIEEIKTRISDSMLELQLKDVEGRDWTLVKNSTGKWEMSAPKIEQ
jgi:hypothetical protein